jgi:hypothetical protein
LGWADTGADDRAAALRLMLENLTAVIANYRRSGIRLFVLAYFVRSAAELQALRDAFGLPLRVARLVVALPDIERRLATDVTSGRMDDLRVAKASIASAQGTGIEDVVIRNDRPVGMVAREVLQFLGWI